MKKGVRSIEAIRLDYAIKALSDRSNLLSEKIADINFMTGELEESPGALDNIGTMGVYKMLKNRGLQYQEEQIFIESLGSYIG